jgi:hypothetical protein
MAAFLSAFVAAGAGAGILWLFVYGDRTWPQAANNAIMGFAVFASIGTLVLLLFVGYSFGKSHETSAGLTRRHVAFAIAISVLLPALALLHQWHVGNLG